jgi:hypothetical protein
MPGPIKGILGVLVRIIHKIIPKSAAPALPVKPTPKPDPGLGPRPWAR